MSNKENNLTSKLKVKNVMTGERLTLTIPLETIKKLTARNQGEFFNIVTANSFYNLIPKNTYNILIQIMSEDFAKSYCKQYKIQFILYNYSSTVASMNQIIEYAKENHLLTLTEPKHDPDENINKLFSGRSQKNNVVKIQMKTNDHHE